MATQARCASSPSSTSAVRRASRLRGRSTGKRASGRRSRWRRRRRRAKAPEEEQAANCKACDHDKQIPEDGALLYMYMYLLHRVLKVTTHQDHIKTSPKFSKMIHRLKVRVGN